MNKIDRRILRSRQALSDAIIQLVNERGYAPVTVRDITRRAGISYSTFFRHFESKDDLTSYVCYLGWQKVMMVVSEEMKPYEDALATFRVISENPELYRFCARVPRDQPVSVEIHQEIADSIIVGFAEHSGGAIPIELAAHIAATAIVEMFRWWIENGMQYSPEEMARIHTELIMKTVLAYVE